MNQAGRQETTTHKAFLSMVQQEKALCILLTAFIFAISYNRRRKKKKPNTLPGRESYLSSAFLSKALLDRLLATKHLVTTKLYLWMG